MKERHSGFLRDVLLSKRARQRGFWNSTAIQNLLSHQSAPGWFDVVWKVLSIETWASIFLDGAFNGASLPKAAYVFRNSPKPNPAELPAKRLSPDLGVRQIWQECRELGARKTLARSVWELKTRSGIARLTNTNTNATFRVIFSEPSAVANAVRPLMSPESLSDLAFQAGEATRGRILCFGKWVADFGNPIDWHRNPLNRSRWRADAHWSTVLTDETRVGDVKLSWEAGRFPQAYIMARCAAFFPETAPDLSTAFLSQVRGFLECNPAGQGIHWNSGQEIALRLMAWLFGLNVFFHDGTIPEDLQTQLSKHISACGAHIAQHIEYARESVYNNHLLSESLALYIAGRILPDVEAAPAWVSKGRRLLEQEANHQVYSDGSYIQQSHNYHRFAIQIYLWALAFARSHSDPIPPDWIRALERSLDFLLAHQNQRTAVSRTTAQTTGLSRFRSQSAISPISGLPSKRRVS